MNTTQEQVDVASERIMVVSRNFLDGISLGEFTRDGDVYSELIRKNCFFIARDLAEQRPDLKQVIVYTVIRWANQVFLFKKSHDEKRRELRGKYSMGVSGHVKEADQLGAPASVLRNALERELKEELIIPAPYSVTLVGVVNSDATEVGYFHVGTVYVVELEEPVVEFRTQSEERQNKQTNPFGNLCPVDELANYYDEMEDWSRILARQILGLKGQPRWSGECTKL